MCYGKRAPICFAWARRSPVAASGGRSTLALDGMGHHFVDKAGLPEGWVPVDSQQTPHGVVELARELHTTHVLHGVDVVAIARRLDCDDWLFRLDDGRVAQVHLTYAVESSPDWPRTQLFESMGKWRAFADAV